MITLRQIDEWHVAAMDYRDQIRDEFLKSLMGNRMKQPMMQQGQKPMMQPQMQQGQMPQQPLPVQAGMMGGQNGPAR